MEQRRCGLESMALEMQVLVTGSEGYIGTALVPSLLAEGHQVRGLDSLLFRVRPFASPRSDIRVVEKDIREASVADFQGFDAVVHLAALSNDPLSDLWPKLTYEINAAATIELARLAKMAGVGRFLFSSSCSMYGAGGNSLLTEDSPINPLTIYAESKVIAERGLLRLADQNFCPVFLRHGTAYGVSPNMRFDLVVNNLVAWAVATRQVRLKSTGNASRLLVHVEDISCAFRAALTAPTEAVFCQALNIGGRGENYRILDVAGLVAATVPGSRVSVAPEADPDRRSYRVDCSKAHDRLSEFRTVWTLERGIEEVARACKNDRFTVDEFEGQRYCRVASLKRRMADLELGTDLRSQDAHRCTNAS